MMKVLFIALWIINIITIVLSAINLRRINKERANETDN